MGLFNDSVEQARKNNLKDMEDKRMRFAEQAAKEGFMPKELLLFSGDKGGLSGSCREGDNLILIAGPDFGGEGEFRKYVIPSDAVVTHREEIDVAAEGLGGIMGFGKKGEFGFEQVFELPDGEVIKLQAIVNRTSYAVCDPKHNALLSTKRRRGDANVVWDFKWMDKHSMPTMRKKVDAILEA